MNRPLVKICGITRPQDAEDAFSLGADFLGMIFAKSPRQVTLQNAKIIMDGTPTFHNFVAVFQNEHRDRVCTVADELGIEFVQLHGEETAEDCAYITQKGFKVIKAFSVKSVVRMQSLEQFDVFSVLFDNSRQGKAGGTGEVFDWSLIEPGVWKSRRAFLSGGLTPENVDEALKVTEAQGLDVSSGVEKSQGVKDVQRMAEFIKRAKRRVS